MTRFTEIICWPFRRKPDPMAIAIPRYRGEPQAWIIQTNSADLFSLFLPTPANGGQGPGEAA